MSHILVSLCDVGLRVGATTKASLALTGGLHILKITQPTEETIMAWSAPTLKEINCGMEINMYSPSEDEGSRGHEPDLF